MAINTVLSLWWLSLLVVLSLLVASVRGHQVYKSSTAHSDFLLDTNSQTLRIVRINLTDEIDMGLTLPPGAEGVPCGEGDSCVDYGVAKVVVSSLGENCKTVRWTVADGALSELKDCVIMKGHWYGGGEQFRQPWPIEQEPRAETAYVTADMLQRINLWYGGVTEPYWISSKGLAVVVDEQVPLFLSLPDGDGDGTADELCLAARQETPFAAADGAPLELHYHVCSADDVRQVHEIALPMFFGHPTSAPDTRMFTEPIWCTWAEYKTQVNVTRVLDLAKEVINRGYPYSQLEIDDHWETCYGSAVFDSEKFPDPKAMTDELHALGFRVTLWIHPFINDNCPEFAFPDQNGYFVKDSNSQTQLTSWWQGDTAGIIDFTNPEAAAWWVARLESLKATTGVDSFKFDAGETNWLPDVFTLNADKTLWPNIYTKRYVDTVASFGGLIEVRAGRANQEQPIFFRMLDKNSDWGYQNGIKTLITTLLHFGILGYPFVLPDMIGGNAYAVQPSEELFVRWTQANAFMPTMQFSLLPWEFGDTANDVALEISRLHSNYSAQIMQVVSEATTSHAPINRPTWWLCPTTEDCLTADQQYLLGDDILVAPVTDKGATEKNVTLPPGDWLSAVDGATYSGPATMLFRDIDLSVLLYFTRV